MITFVTLNTIVTDLLKIIRGSKVTQSETISKRQLEFWVHQYRSLFIKRDIDKGKYPNPDYIQELNCIKLTREEIEGTCEADSDYYVYRTSLKLPNTIDLNYKSGILYVGTITGEEIQLVPQGRSLWQQYKKYTPSDKLAYLKNGYLYIQSTEGLKYISLRGIFEVPTEASNFVNECTNQVCYGIDDPYPIPINILPSLKEEILRKELKIQATAYSDGTNDSANKVEPNVKTNAANQNRR